VNGAGHAGVGGRARRLFQLSLREIGELVVAQGFLLTALWTVRRRAKGDLLRPVPVAEASAGATDEQRLARVAVAVDRVSRHGLFRPTCLVRAIALERLVRRAHAGHAVVRVGVLKGGREFFAHAWIEIDGRVVGDEPSHVRRFTPLESFSALGE
jgi:hypothetical protein